MKEGKKTPHSHSHKHDSAGGHIFAVHKRPWTAETGRTVTRSQAELTVTELPSLLLGARPVCPQWPASHLLRRQPPSQGRWDPDPRAGQ